MRYLILIFILNLCAPWALADSTAKPPHIVILLADDHSAQDMSAYGADDIPTPRLDAMAAAGMKFTQAFVNSPSCAPSRAALLTGMYPAHNGAEPNHTKVRPGVKKLPAYLQELGYEVVSFGKVSHYAHVEDYGFDLAKGYGYHDHTGISAAVDFLKNRQSEKPLALFVGTNWPHVPLPEKDAVKPEAVRVLPNQLDTPEYREYRARYVNAVKKMDEELGTVYEAAKQTLGAEKTFFLMSSDHGSQFPFGKWNLYDAGIRVPMIVQWQGQIQPGSQSAALVQWTDVLPTLIQVAGGQPDGFKELDGRSMLPVLTGKTDQHQAAIFTAHTSDTLFNVYPSRSIRTHRWKYIRNLHPEYRFTTHIERQAFNDMRPFWRSWEKSAETDAHAAELLQRYRQRPAEELYDLQSDPYELKNLAAVSDHAAELQKLRQGLDNWLKQTGDKLECTAKPSLLAEPFSLLTDQGKHRGHPVPVTLEEEAKMARNPQ
jgi:N-sulfoglucosamine sulfohydrolase